MSDTATQGAATAPIPAPPAPEGGPQHPSPPPAPAPTEPTTAPAESEQPITADYVRSLREENARYRTRASELERRFGGLPDEAMGAIEDFVDLLRTGRTAEAGEWAIQASRTLTGESWPQLVARYGTAGAQRVVEQAAVDAAGQAGNGTSSPLTAEDLDRRLDEWSQRQEQARSEAEMRAREAEFVKQIDDQFHAMQIHPESPMAQLIIAQAQQMLAATGLPVTMQDARAELLRVVNGGPSLPPSVPGAPPAPAGVPGDTAVRDPREAARNRLRAAAAQPG